LGTYGFQAFPFDENGLIWFYSLCRGLSWGLMTRFQGGRIDTVSILKKSINRLSET
jgi:hypothetical protein